MNTLSATSLTLLGNLLVATLGASALTVEIEQGAFRGGTGGEFVALTSGSSLNDDYAPAALQTVTSNAGTREVGFGTFCLERLERVSFSDPYEAVLNQRAMSGGVDKHDPVGAGPAGDPISRATAYLYSQFAKGTLDSYAYGDGTDGYSPAEIADRKASSAALQNAIWFFEDELSLKRPLENRFIKMAIDRFGKPGAFASSEGAYGVSAMNLTFDGRRRQDVLVYQVSDTGWTLGLLGAGLILVAASRRRDTVTA